MAYPSITSALAKIVMDAKMKVMSDLIEQLESEFDMKDDSMEDLKNFFEKFQKDLKSSEEEVVKIAGKKSKKDGTEKKKRAPSAYNLFIKDMSPVLKEKNPNVKGKELMALTSAEWKSGEYAAFLKKKIKEMQEEDKTVVYEIETLYNIAKKIYNESYDKEEKPKTNTKKATSDADEENPKTKHKAKKATSDDEEEKPKAKGKSKKIKAEEKKNDSDSD